MYHLKEPVDGIHPKVGVFDGRKPIWILYFITNLRNKINTLGTSEAAEVRVST